MEYIVTVTFNVEASTAEEAEERLAYDWLRYIDHPYSIDHLTVSIDDIPEGGPPLRY